MCYPKRYVQLLVFFFQLQSCTERVLKKEMCSFRAVVSASLLLPHCFLFIFELRCSYYGQPFIPTAAVVSGMEATNGNVRVPRCGQTLTVCAVYILFRKLPLRRAS